MLQIQFGINHLSKVHKRVIREIVEQNPTASMEEIAEHLSTMPELATLPVEMNAETLRALGYSDPAPTAPTSPASPTSPTSPNQGQLSPNVLRQQLERRHNQIERRLSELLNDESIASSSAIKIYEALSKIDEKIISQLLDMMQQEAAPALPMAIIIMCLRRQGVPEEEIKIVQETI